MEEAAITIQRWWWQSAGCRLPGPTGEDGKKLTKEQDKASRKIQTWWMSMERLFVIPLTFYNKSRRCSRYYVRYMMEADKKTQAWQPSHSYEGQEYELAAKKIQTWWRSLPSCYDCGVKNEILGGYRPRCWACYDTKYGPF